MLDSCHASLRSCALAVSVPLFLAASSARAQQPTETSGRHEHEGFALRFLLGPSYVLATNSIDDEDVSVGGGGATLQIALGYNVLPRLIVHAELFAAVTVSPTFELGERMEQPDDTSFGVSGLGAGLTYYLPRNFFLSASIDVVTLRLESEEDGRTVASESAEGLGGNFMFGSEFWVSDGWAMGAAVQLILASIPEDEADDSWTAGSIGAGLSATFD